MVIEINQVNNVSSFICSQSKLCLLTSNGVTVNKNHVLNLTNIKGDLFRHGNNKFIWQDFEGFFFIVDYEKGLLDKIAGYYNYLITESDKIYYFDINSGSCFCYYEHQSAKLPFKSNGYLLKNKYISIIGTKILSQDISGKVLWETDIKTQFSYVGFNGKIMPSTISRLLAINDILWLSLSSGRLIGLNEQTGKVVFNISNPNHAPADYEFRKEEEYLHYGLYMNVDKERNMLFGLHGHYYFEIDLAAPANCYTMYEVKDSLQAAGFSEVNVSGKGYEHAWHGDEIFLAKEILRDPR
jgi:hypothetical protein